MTEDAAPIPASAAALPQGPGEAPAGTAPVYIARQIAAVLGITKRAVRMHLAGRPGTILTVRGQQTHAWAIPELPPILREKLQTAALAQHYASVEAMMRERAPEADAPKPSPCSATPNATPDFSLHRDLAGSFADYLKDRANLARAEAEWVWAEAIRHFEVLLAVTPDAERRAIKPGLIRFLMAEVPGLVRSGGRQFRTFQRAFERKFDAYIKNGRAALRDGRQIRSGNYRDGLCSPCWKKFTDLAILHGGSESLAWRELKRAKALCPSCNDRYKFDPRAHKSYVPPSIRKAATPLVNAALPWRKSVAAGRLAGPYIPRDHSDTAPGDHFVADDVTWNHKVFAYDQDGRPQFFRPECLYIADERTSYPLTQLYIRGHYNGRHVRQLVLQTHDLFGLPHKGLKFENGVWRSRLVRDEDCGNTWIDFRETEDGFKTLQDLIVIRHCQPRNPRAKVVEGDFRILQERMRREPGFVGFNERAERSDTEKDFERRCRAGQEDPRNGSMYFEDWCRAASAIFEAFANEPQNGARNPGRSPSESWKEGIDSRPLRKLPNEARYILATCRRAVRVTEKGILLNFGRNEKWAYAGEHLAAFVGKDVWIYWHMDCPEFLTVCDWKQTQYFSAIGVRLPANTASKEQLQRAQTEIHAFNRGAQVIAAAVRNPIAATITRDNAISPAQRETGRRIEAGKTLFLENQRRETGIRAQQQEEGLRMMLAAAATPENPNEDPAP